MIAPLPVAGRARKFFPPVVRRAVVFLAAAAALLGACSSAARAQEPDRSLEAVAALQDLLVQAIEQNERSVVAVARGRRGTDDYRLTDPDFIPNEFATGVVIDAGGLILTNFHVLGDPEQSRYAVWIDQRGYDATIKAADAWSDLAVLQIEAENLRPVRLGDASNLKRGQIVIAMGNPYAIARDGQPSATWGIISNLSRKAMPLPDEQVASGKDTVHHYGTLIQTDARLPLGTSGGALLNLQGEMIGLTSSLAALSGYEQSAGFAIPVDDIFQRVLQQLKAGRNVDYGFLGMGGFRPVLDEKQPSRPIGVRVGEVIDATPAATADLRPGDVITGIEGKPVLHGDDITVLLSRYAPGTTVTVSLARDDSIFRSERTLEKQVVLAKKPPVPSRTDVVSVPPPDWRGLRVDYPTALPRFRTLVRQEENGRRLIDPKGCVAVVEVLPDSPAWKAGLREGMFIAEAAGDRATDPETFYRLLGRQTGPVTLETTLPFDARTQFVVPGP